jgi:hypothetical protein
MLDLLVLNGVVDSVIAFLGNVDGTFEEAVQTPIPLHGAGFGLQIVDFNHDGYIDVISAYAILLGNGDERFTIRGLNSWGKGSYQFPSRVADFDGDGVLDIRRN